MAKKKTIEDVKEKLEELGFIEMTDEELDFEDLDDLENNTIYCELRDILTKKYANDVLIKKIIRIISIISYSKNIKYKLSGFRVIRDEFLTKEIINEAFHPKYN